MAFFWLLLVGTCLMPMAVASQSGSPADTVDSLDLNSAAQPYPTEPPPDAEEQFRTLFAAGDYAAALPFALDIVRLMESDETRRDDLASAYNELAATQLRLNDLEGAEASYRRSLQLTEISHGISTERLITPLAGLGATYAAKDQHARAIEYLRRAIVVSRRAEGLFNLSQLELMERLVASFAAIKDPLGVLAERLYALKIAEQNFGVNDSRTLPAVTQLAELYESMTEYPFARAKYVQMQRIGLQEGDQSNLIIVTALLGIARNHRLQFTHDPHSLLEKALYRDPATGQFAPILSLEPIQSPRPDRQGRKALVEALALLRRADSPPPRLLTQALIEMGDWEVALDHIGKALPHYAEAWGVYAAQLTQEKNPLAGPRLVFYRAPTAAKREHKFVSEQIVTRTAQFRLSVDETGVPRDIVLEQYDVSLTQADYLRRSLENARYSPRFEAGKPVQTTDVLFVGDWEALVD